eukprot:13250518-Heterocapsa_arctica.AAC.2
MSPDVRRRWFTRARSAQERPSVSSIAGSHSSSIALWSAAVAVTRSANCARTSASLPITAPSTSIELLAALTSHVRWMYGVSQAPSSAASASGCPMR